MEYKDFKREMEEKARKIEITLNEEQIQQFYRYMQMLIEWNEKINLTAITDPEEIILKHFIDSLTIANKIKENSSIIDIGTGAGFPGIPLKIYNNTYKILLVDSLQKRVNFLNEVIEEIKLKEIEAIHGRAEELGNKKEYREKFDYATSRAVANLSTLVEYLIPFVKIEGECICMKGTKVEEELENAKNAINLLGGKIVKKEVFDLANTDNKRTIILIKKERNTPKKYPRKAGVPSKNPITIQEG